MPEHFRPDPAMDALHTIESLISEDAGGRGIAPLVQPGHLAQSARSLLAARSVVIVSGFFIPRAMAGETDGPPGAKALGDALRALNIPVSYLTDRHNEPLFETLQLHPLYTSWDEIPAHERPSHLVAVERVGRAGDGRYYNMRGEDISAFTAPLDDPFLHAGTHGMTTIGIADGGNEIGMGLVTAKVHLHVAEGRRIASTVPTDFLIVCGVSNWGAYGLAGALGLLSGRDLLPGAQDAASHVRCLVEAGAVDGQTHRRESTVDGLPLAKSLSVLEAVRKCAAAAAR